MSAIITGDAGRGLWVPTAGLIHGKKIYRPGGTVSSNVTLALQTTLEAPFTAVRFGFLNVNAAAQTITKMIAAPSGTLSAAGVAPINAAGAVDYTLFKPVLFGGAASGTVPAATANAGTGQATQSLLMSDWLALPSLARTDGGTLPILMTRTYSASTAYGGQPTTTELANQNAADAARTYLGYYLSGDKVTTPSSWTTATAANYFSPDIIQYQTTVKGASVMGVGDSRTQGYSGSTTGTNYYGAEYQACLALSQPSFPVSFINGGFSGQQDASFIANGTTLFNALQPDITIIETMSPNDTSSQVQAITSFNAAMGLAATIVAAGKQAILRTPMPWTLSLASDSYRKWCVQQVRSQGLYPVIDYDAISSNNGAATVSFVAWLASPDGIHPSSPAGYAAMVPAVIPVLQKCLALI